MTMGTARNEIRFEFSGTGDGESTDLLVTTPRLAVRPFRISDPLIKANTIDRLLPGWLNDFRVIVGNQKLKLSRNLATDALWELYGVARLTIRTLFEDDESEERLFLREVGAAVSLALANATSDPATWPIVNVIEGKAGRLGRSIPFEIFPIAAPFSSQEREIPRFEAFLGLRAPIVRMRQRGKESLRRDAAGQISMLLLSGRDALRGVDDQRDFFRRSESEFNINEWPQRDRQFARPAVRELADQWAQHREIIHLACHYGISGVSPNTSAMFDFGSDCQVPSDTFAIALEDRLGEQSGERPFLFLNACNSATPAEPNANLLDRLIRLEYHDLVGGRCLLPDQIAAQFAIVLYNALLSSDHPGLADAVVMARRKLTTDEFLNPAGLLYVHYGSALLHAEPRRQLIAAPGVMTAMANAPRVGILGRMRELLRR